ncbi:MAG TPA: molybdenum cofactor biosynthesis protein MoaE [Longimicrobiales bacterium]|nr:molybdenum cofactor biosynthesis protein MoaE [Longimicrobiales bacterium]
MTGRPQPRDAGVRARITTDAIRPGDVLSMVGDRRDGAVLLFLGTVRDHADGLPVERLSYEAYGPMAERVLGTIAREAADRLGTPRLAVVHRVGDLEIGDVSVAIAASSPHRAESFDAVRYVIEEIKKRLPVWKHEHRPGGEARWVEGVTPPVPEAAGE